jgi:hypothetical protein
MAWTLRRTTVRNTAMSADNCSAPRNHNSCRSGAYVVSDPARRQIARVGDCNCSAQRAQPPRFFSNQVPEPLWARNVEWPRRSSIALLKDDRAADSKHTRSMCAKSAAAWFESESQPRNERDLQGSGYPSQLWDGAIPRVLCEFARQRDEAGDGAPDAGAQDRGHFGRRRNACKTQAA